MQANAEIYGYKRLATREVKVGNLLLGNFNPIRIQTMTTTDTMDTAATVAQSIRCIEAGAELIRITAPSKNEAENLLNIKNELRKRGYATPLVADIHFTPNAAEIAARIVEKVRINPGNYVDKKKFELLEYSDAEYLEEIDRIRERFTPVLKICKQYGTAMRIGTNHGSLSDRIMSRYGDTAMGMVESAMEFLRIAESENYYNIVLSMKSSNPQVMIEACRLLMQNMQTELGVCYPLHLGVTEAGDGEDGRIKSAIGIGTLLEEGIGDTIRVSLTEDPEFEIPVCKNILKHLSDSTAPQNNNANQQSVTSDPGGERRKQKISSDISFGRRAKTNEVANIGGKHVPVVIADLSKHDKITPSLLEDIGYNYNSITDKWNITDAAADYIFTDTIIEFALPGTLKIICNYDMWKQAADKKKYLPLFDDKQYLDEDYEKSSSINFVMIDCYSEGYPVSDNDAFFNKLKKDPTAVICLSSQNKNAVHSIKQKYNELFDKDIINPVIIICDSSDETMDESLIHYAIDTGSLFVDGIGNGICLGYHFSNKEIVTDTKLLNSIAFGILQATRTRISKTEYISCPSCGRTLFDLQETTAKIRAVTNHLKGVKIAIMGCIVNGPGEMADADFGYVGSGPGKVTLYKGKEVVKRSVPEAIAVEELINLIKENEAWIEPGLKEYVMSA
ncbi:MAG: (E)-4-hydroxy-3-methylbut-2-enyl-diphosphate synthase [Chitinophagaceae bacterium]|nr:(E)-4-hydroxy-3-methylbut-2-enyl-diphosphate synthase [Chitinophagaceae bacterium]